MKALIKVGYGCNEHCTFCHTQDVRHIDAEAAEVEAKIRRARALGHSMVVLSGGEPTIRPELVRWATMVAELDMDFGLVSNGLMLAYPEVVEQLLAQRLRYVYMSLHGGERAIHNRLVRRDTFDVASSAISNLSGRGLDLTANCVVTKSNVEHLGGLVRLLAPLADVRVKFSMTEPKGGAWHLFEQVVPDVEVAARSVAAALELGAELTGAPERFVHGGFPLCLLPGYEDRYDDLRTHRFATMIEVGEDDFFPVDDENKTTPEQPCGRCSLRGPCPGLFTAYRERHGDQMLRPRAPKLRSNAFDYVFESVVAVDQPDDVCQLREDGVAPWDRGRHLFVRHQGKVGRYRADSRDFSDDAITRIKHELGQIYLDASKKVAPDDFGRDLVKLTRASMCATCPEKEPCTGMFEPVFESVFEADDEPVRSVLSTLRGRVLDVGCGSAPYMDVFANAASAGEIDYLGLDPDSSELERLESRWPSVRTRLGTLDDLPQGARFDHITVLRSWNHLPDPQRAAQQIAAALDTGGSLLVVDNVAFGLARTAAQTARARRSDTPRFEHYRNDSAEEAHRVLASVGLRLAIRRDIDPARSNQWFLRYDAAS